METADTVAADAAYAKGFAEAKRAAVEAVRDTEEPFGESRLMASRREAIASIRATEPKVQP